MSTPILSQYIIEQGRPFRLTNGNLTASLGDFIDLCSKKGYDVSGAAGAAALVPPSGTISKNPPKSTQHSQTTAIASGSAPAASASATGTSGIDSLNRGDKTSIALAAAAVCLVRGLWFR